MYNIIGNSKASHEATKLTKKSMKEERVRKRVLWCLNFCTAFAQTLGGKLNTGKSDTLQYRIDRRNVYVKSQRRRITVMEMTGALRLLVFVGVLFSCTLLVLTGSMFSLIFMGVLLVKPILMMLMDSSISEEDAKLEKQFPDFFLLVYSRLIMGANVRLAPVTGEFLNTLEITGSTETKKAIGTFVRELRSNIEIYAEDTIALTKMRDKYKSATVVNFINLATQALSGVDNRDKLNAFKAELTNKKLEGYRQAAQKSVEKAQKAIIIVWILLGEFVVLSWVSKLGPTLSSFSGVFG